MSCLQTLNGIAADCNSNIGGIIVVYIANFADVSTCTVDASTKMITAITMDTGKKFKTYNFKKNTGSLSSNYSIDPANGINFVQSDLVLSFNRLETAKRIEIGALALGELAVIVKDANGKYFYLGYNEFVAATAGAALTGTNRTDKSGYDLTLTDYSRELPYEIKVGDGGVDLSEIVE